MQAKARTLGMLTVLLVAGCLGPAAPAANEDAPHGSEAAQPGAAEPRTEVTRREAPADDGRHAGAASASTPFDPARRAEFTFTETGCYAMNVIIHLPRTQVQQWLPDGFVAETVDDTYARGIGVHDWWAAAQDPAEGEWTPIWPEVHACPGPDGSFHGAAWLWVAVERPSGYDHLEPSGFDAYEVCYAGYDDEERGEHATIVEARMALGFTVCGNSMTMDEPFEDLLGPGWVADVTQDGEAHWGMAVEQATEASLTVPGLYRIWHQTRDGMAHMDYTHIVGDDPASPVHYSVTFECTMAPGSIPAQVIGHTSCDDAVAAGTYILGLFLPPHNMEVTFVYEPFDG